MGQNTLHRILYCKSPSSNFQLHKKCSNFIFTVSKSARQNTKLLRLILYAYFYYTLLVCPNSPLKLRLQNDLNVICRVFRSQLRRKDNARALCAEAFHEERAGHHEHAKRPAPSAAPRQLRARAHARARRGARRGWRARQVCAHPYTWLCGTQQTQAQNLVSYVAK